MSNDFEVFTKNSVDRCRSVSLKHVFCRPVFQVRTPAATSAYRHKRLQCRAEGQAGPGRQYETEFFRKFFGAPPAPKQDDASGNLLTHNLSSIIC